MTVRVSTDMVDSRSQLQFWREVVCDTFVPFAFEPRRGQSARFHGEVISEDLGVARLTTVISEPHGLSRPAELVRRSGQDDLLVDVVVRGRVTVGQDERTAVLRPGDLTVYDSARPSAISFSASRREQTPARAIILAMRSPPCVVSSGNG